MKQILILMALAISAYAQPKQPTVVINSPAAPIKNMLIEKMAERGYAAVLETETQLAFERKSRLLTTRIQFSITHTDGVTKVINTLAANTNPNEPYLGGDVGKKEKAKLQKFLEEIKEAIDKKAVVR